jgi:DNA invertase Pin-like site-specific DNA recombinase
LPAVAEPAGAQSIFPSSRLRLEFGASSAQCKESIDDQLRECRELCRRHDSSVINEFSDTARSGNEVNRSGYQRLLRAARHRKYDVIVAHELSRLWRSESEMLLSTITRETSG